MIVGVPYLKFNYYLLSEIKISLFYAVCDIDITFLLWYVIL